ncbi:MAG: hypothetical protein M3014_12310 [Chloroflexota bacterium]|nr:hypothetical protein [Chloroflexota bacterium]
MRLDAGKLRSRIEWSSEYRPEWDGDAALYVEHNVVGWGRSRRLGMLRLGSVKAYLGVQHVDPMRAGWAIVDEPQARFFLSLFVGGECVTLRVFPSMGAALDALLSFLSRVGD